MPRALLPGNFRRMLATDIDRATASAAAAGGAEKRAYVQRIFSEIAPRYDLLNHVLSLNIDRRWRRKAIASLGVSLPAPFIGLLFLWIVVSKWQLLPYTSNTVTSPWNPDPWTWFKNYILAWLTLALIFGANYVRLPRANMIETMGEDYIRTARAKGLPSRTVTLKHGLRAAITPVVTVFGLDLGALLGGAVLTETIFSVPGLGRTAVNATFNEDLPVVMAVVLFSAFFIIFANIIVDILYAVIDPRVRLN